MPGGRGWQPMIRFVERQKGLLAANVYQQDELRGVKEVIQAGPYGKGFRMIFLSQIAKQLPWNDILNKKQGGWGVGLRVLL